MSDLPQGYEPHEIPADYVGPLFIEGQMRAFAETETMRLREAARMALEALAEATTYTGSESWSPSMTRDCERARDALREALK